MLVLLLAVLGQAPSVPLVEVMTTETIDTPREAAAIEDAIAIGFNSDELHVETRRQRLTRTPPAVYFHQQALQACANPYWPKVRVLKCVEKIQFPGPLKSPKFIRATHILRISHARTDEGELMVMTLQTLGAPGDEQVVRRTLPRDAGPVERKGTALAMAGELVQSIRHHDVAH